MPSLKAATYQSLALPKGTSGARDVGLTKMTYKVKVYVAGFSTPRTVRQSCVKHGPSIYSLLDLLDLLGLLLRLPRSLDFFFV